RSRVLGGRLTLAPGPEGGTALTMVLPRQLPGA
ncbi:MAG TPA: histidine kinase, partial [Massilia sp.]|nr:histidine kinase [Massilia sp.]